MLEKIYLVIGRFELSDKRVSLNHRFLSNIENKFLISKIAIKIRLRESLYQLRSLGLKSFAGVRRNAVHSVGRNGFGW